MKFHSKSKYCQTVLHCRLLPSIDRANDQKTIDFICRDQWPPKQWTHKSCRLLNLGIMQKRYVVVHETSNLNQPNKLQNINDETAYQQTPLFQTCRIHTNSLPMKVMLSSFPMQPFQSKQKVLLDINVVKEGRL